MDPFVNHHVHTHFSALDGFPTPEDAAQRVAEMGQKSISITDHGSLSGVPEMHRAAKKYDLGFTPGCEMYFSTDNTLEAPDRLGEKYYHMILLAHTDQGWKNLMKLQTLAEEGYYYKPRIDYSSLEQHHEGLTVTTACLGGLVNQHLLRGNVEQAHKELSTLVDIMGKENVFVEIQNHGIPEQQRILPQQVELAQSMGLGLLATSDSHYARQSDAGVHDTLLCCSVKRQKSDTNRFKFDSDQFFLHSGEEMLKIFPEDQYPGAVSNSLDIAERTDFELKIDENKEYLMPRVKTEDGMNEAQTLREHVLKGAYKTERYGQSDGTIPDTVQERIDYELGVIENMGYPGYFLMVENLVKVFADNGIFVGAGRGCIAGHVPILTAGGMKHIRDICVGDTVFDQNGREVVVPEVFEYNYGEDLIQIKAYYGGEGVTLTPDHEVLVSQSQASSENLATPRWVRADEVNYGDLVVMPQLQSDDTVTGFPIEQNSWTRKRQGAHTFAEVSRTLHMSVETVRRWSHGAVIDEGRAELLMDYCDVHNLDRNELGVEVKENKKLSTDYLDADYELGYIIGFFIANGWIETKADMLVGFATQASKDDALLPLYLESVFGLEIDARKDAIEDMNRYIVRHRGVRAFFRELLPDYELTAQTKYIPEQFFHTPEDFRQGLLKGLWAGDGSYSAGTCRYRSASQRLAYGVERLLLSLGCPAGVKRTVQKNTRPDFSTKKSFEIYTVTTAPNFKDIHASCGAPYDGHFMYYKVRDIQTVPNPTGKVYDFTVPTTHSYVTDSFVVHNSAPGSIVSYCLGITHLDPLVHDLYFERFLNPDRISMPDIDIDVPKSKRKQALELIEQEYGKGHVAHLANYQLMAARTALERTAKAYGLNPQPANDFRNKVATYCEEHSVSLKDVVNNGLPGDVKNSLPPTPFTDTIIADASRLEGRLYAYGIHACGIVITQDPIDDHFPIRYSKKAQLPVCQFDGRDTEALGGVKMDILGLINLDEVEDAKTNTLLDLGIDVPEEHGLDDPAVYDMLSNGRGGGVFQLGCVSGDTIIDGERIDKMYQLRHSTQQVAQVRSFFPGQGEVKPNDCLSVVFSGEKQTYTLTTKTGQSIRATQDHKFFTTQGYKALEELVVGHDQVLVVDDKDGYEPFPDTMRGRQDILDLYASWHPELMPHTGTGISVGNQVVFPTFENKDRAGHFVIIYSDENYKKSMWIPDETDGKIHVVSYSDIIEHAYEEGIGDELLLPDSAQYSLIESITPYEVEKTYDLMMSAPVHNFVANGIVVHNSSGIQSTSRMIRPTEFADLSALIALYRPGPMGMKTPEEYARRKNGGQAQQINPHEDMDTLLEKSNGLAVYQEDIMRLSTHYAGYTGAEADDLRKAVAKKVPAMMDAQKKKFIPAVNERYPDEDDLGQKLWDIIEPFGAYAFCKAHSAAYAMTVYETAWWKSHYPAQFSAAVIDQNLTDQKKLAETVAWVREEHVSISVPDVNASEMRSVTTEDSVILPLQSVAGVGEAKAKEIVEEREKNGQYSSVVDVIARTKLPRSLVIKLAKAGAFDSLHADRGQILSQIDTIMSLAHSHQGRMKVSQGLFGDVIDTMNDTEDIDLEQPVTEQFMLDDKPIVIEGDTYAFWERDVLGIFAGAHPYGIMRSNPDAQKILTIYPPVDVYEHEHDTPVKMSGMITNIVNKVSAKGKEFTVFSLETDKSVVPAIVFSRLDPAQEGSVVAVVGTIENDAGFNDDDESEFVPKVLATKMTKIKTEAFGNDTQEGE